MTTAELLPIDRPATESRDSVSTATHSDLQKQTRSLLRTEISFVPNPEFRCADVAELERTFSWSNSSTSASPARELPAHLARLCESDLLTAEEERSLFRRMNLLKFWANRLRCQLDPDRPAPAKITRLTQYVDEAERIRDHLIKSNMRLVLSIARKFVSPQNSFDDLLSDGVMCLMQAVEKFDFARGFRFSTYAYRSVSRSLYRTINENRRQIAQLGGYDSSIADRVLDTSRSNLTDRLEEQQRALLMDAVGRLDRRERFIIRSRFALGSHRRKRTCRELAERLGISKERVRQLEQRAILRIEEMVAESRGQESE